MTACQSNSIPLPTPTPVSTPMAAAKSELQAILSQPKILPVVNQQDLYLVSPSLGQAANVYHLEDQEAPVNPALDTFTVSQDRRWVVWYTPTKGVIALDVLASKTVPLHPPSEFLNTNPYLDFSTQTNEVMFITNKGNTLHRLMADSLEDKLIEIPYPYGNLFKVSPDEKAILFISGYGQTQVKPKFMFTNYEGRYANQFTSETNLSERHWVVWTPDSTGVLMIVNADLIYYPLVKPDASEKMFSVPQGQSILAVYRQGDRIFTLSDKDYWHIFSYKAKKEVARTPLAMASELRHPFFLPWSETEFLIEETLVDGEIQFKRLWGSDLLGTKHLVMERYNESIVKTKLEKLN